MVNKVESNELLLNLTNVNPKEESKYSTNIINNQNDSQIQYLPSYNILQSLNLEEDQKNENGLIQDVQFVTESEIITAVFDYEFKGAAPTFKLI